MPCRAFGALGSACLVAISLFRATTPASERYCLAVRRGDSRHLSDLLPFRARRFLGRLGPRQMTELGVRLERLKELQRASWC